MGKTTRNKPEPQVEVVQAAWGPVLTKAAFGLTIALIIARALVSETLRDAFEMTPGASPAPRGAGAAVSLVLDLICWIPALLVLVRRAIEKDYSLSVRWSHALFAAF